MVTRQICLVSVQYFTYEYVFQKYNSEWRVALWYTIVIMISLAESGTLAGCAVDLQ
jgi:hypothetical protein